eukprot:283084-Rhodomonas_salina.1
MSRPVKTVTSQCSNNRHEGPWLRPHGRRREFDQHGRSIARDGRSGRSCGESRRRHPHCRQASWALPPLCCRGAQ